MRQQQDDVVGSDDVDDAGHQGNGAAVHLQLGDDAVLGRLKQVDGPPPVPTDERKRWRNLEARR